MRLVEKIRAYIAEDEAAVAEDEQFLNDLQNSGVNVTFAGSDYLRTLIVSVERSIMQKKRIIVDLYEYLRNEIDFELIRNG